MTAPEAEREAAAVPRTDAIRKFADEYARGHTVPELEAHAAESYMCGYTDGAAAGRGEAESLAAVVQGMKHYLVFGKVHADFAQQELLEKFGVADFQGMAFLAYERADALLPEPPEATS